MTLEDLKTRCLAQGFQYAYGVFKKPVEMGDSWRAVAFLCSSSPICCC